MRTKPQGGGFEKALEWQLVSSFIAVFSFGMGVLVTPALMLNGGSDEVEEDGGIDYDNARLGTLPGDHYLLVQQAERKIVSYDAGRLKRLRHLEAVLLRRHIGRQELSQTFKVSIDTIRRDIQTLISFGSDATYRSKLGWRSGTAVFVANVPLEPQDDEIHGANEGGDSVDDTIND